ncbi:AraC family transcriptional regulator [Bacteroides sp.]|uniref:helix-turn-helix domain-containing protein n=1 Tax=Bacteroides sp. TaxID=29523 RepID=UPI00262D0DF8|nr:AraC family transcriptional regulator [Bacteroides sp.]MDD3038694.1 AraC family transcriptional regulator [Bacteroides sp.]
MQQVRQLPPTYRVAILLEVASRDEGRKAVIKQEDCILEALPLASKKEKKKLLLHLVDYYARYGSFSPMSNVRKKCFLRVAELEEHYSLSQEESWAVKKVKALILQNLSETERALSVYFELLAEHRAADKPELIIEDLGSIATIFSSLGDHEKAISLQKEAYQLAVEHQLPEYQKKCSRSLVVGLYRLGKYAEIIELYWKTNLDFFARSEYNAYSMLASCHLQLARPDSARFYLEKMVQGSATASDATFYSRLAETYLSENREDSATATMTKLIDCLRKEAKSTEGLSEADSPFPFSFLPVCSSYATLLHHNGKDREASETFRLIVPLMEEFTETSSILADQIDALTRYSNLCRSLRQYEKVSDLLTRRDSLRDIYIRIIDKWDKKRVIDRFKTSELMYTIEKQQTQLAYSNRILIIVGVATLVLGCSIVALVVFYRQRRRQLLLIQDKEFEIERLRTEVLSSGGNSSVPVFSPQEELFRTAERKIATERLFLNKELSLELLARILDTNRSYLSSAVNSHSGSNFNQWLNDYRIQYILARIHTTNDLIHLADEAGFASLNSFYRNFKRCTGMTPNEYLKQAITA